MSSQPDTLDLTPDGNAVNLATQWLEGIAEREDWPVKVSFGLVLSLDEALTNIVSYAFAEHAADADAPAVTLSYHRADADLVVEIGDNGQAYDPTLAVPPPLAASLDEAEAGGHGLRLMRHYLKSFAYRREHGWNYLTLVAASA